MTYTSRIPQIAAALPSVIDAALRQGAELIADDAETRLAPHKLSGELEREIHVDDKQRDGIYVVAGDPSDPSFAFYGHMLEFGTSHSAPRPFLVPAFEANRDNVVSLATAAVKGLL
jgi:HK97 gp10 family phage protein